MSLEAPTCRICGAKHWRANEHVGFDAAVPKLVAARKALDAAPKPKAGHDPALAKTPRKSPAKPRKRSGPSRAKAKP